MKLKILFILFVLINLICANIENIREDRILFCLDKSVEPLSTNRNYTIDTAYNQLNTILKRYGVIYIEPWLPGATDEDYDGDIYLNRIYRVHFNNRSIDEIDILKDELATLNIIHSVEYEYKRYPLYTPNDQYYNNQWFLPVINSNDAWNLWTDLGDIPGNQNVILASVDLGVNYDHDDLINNMWQNLGEDVRQVVLRWDMNRFDESLVPQHFDPLLTTVDVFESSLVG